MKHLRASSPTPLTAEEMVAIDGGKYVYGEGPDGGESTGYTFSPPGQPNPDFWGTMWESIKGAVWGEFLDDPFAYAR